MLVNRKKIPVKKQVYFVVKLGGKVIRKMNVCKNRNYDVGLFNEHEMRKFNLEV